MDHNTSTADTTLEARSQSSLHDLTTVGCEKLSASLCSPGRSGYSQHRQPDPLSHPFYYQQQSSPWVRRTPCNDDPSLLIDARTLDVNVNTNCFPVQNFSSIHSNETSTYYNTMTSSYHQSYINKRNGRFGSTNLLFENTNRQCFTSDVNDISKYATISSKTLIRKSPSTPDVICSNKVNLASVINPPSVNGNIEIPSNVPIDPPSMYANNPQSTHFITDDIEQNVASNTFLSDETTFVNNVDIGNVQLTSLQSKNDIQSDRNIEKDSSESFKISNQQLDSVSNPCVQYLKLNPQKVRLKNESYV